MQSACSKCLMTVFGKGHQKTENNISVSSLFDWDYEKQCVLFIQDRYREKCQSRVKKLRPTVSREISQ